MSGKLLRRLTLILCTTLLCTALVSCFSCGGNPQSAYDLAVEKGFVGTEEQWLASLHGQDLDIMDIYRQAIADGAYTGEKDFLSFLTDYLHLDSEMVARAILDYQQRNTSSIVALPLLGSVRIECVSSDTSGTTSAAGSGVILSMERNEGNAYILTNYHVVMQSNEANAAPHSSINVFLYGDTRSSETAIAARYIGGCQTYDIAVLKISGSERLMSSNALPVSVENSDTVITGADAIAIGNAAGQGISVTRGIVSIDSKEVRLSAEGNTQRLIQVDTPINEGNSGGGLFNTDGKLIGIVNAKVESENVENIGYAIPSNIAVNAAKSIIASYESSGTSFIFSSVPLKVARIGINGLEAKDAHATYDPERQVTYLTEKVMVSSFSEGSIARAAGLKRGDVILQITVDDTTLTVNRIFTLQDALLLCRAGSTVTLQVLRGDATETVTFVTPAVCFETIS